jgi:hypothetical protein
MEGKESKSYIRKLIGVSLLELPKTNRGFD